MSKLLQKFNEADPLLFTPSELVQLLQEAPQHEAYSIILRLFATPSLHHAVTADNITQLFEASKANDLIFGGELFKLPEPELQRLLTSKSITALIKQRPNDILLSLNLEKFCQKYSFVLSEEDLQFLDYTNDSHLKFLVFTSSAMNYIDRSQLDPVIAKLFERTYVGHGKKRDFVSKLAYSLKKVIDSNSALKELIARATDKGNILIGDVAKLKLTESESAAGLCSRDDLTISVAGNIDAGSYQYIENVIGTIVHELTHRLIQIEYGNEMQPFRRDDNAAFDQIMNAVAKESKKEANAHILAYIRAWGEVNPEARAITPIDKPSHHSWLSLMVADYKPEKYAIEILPNFTGQIARLILLSNKPEFSGAHAKLLRCDNVSHEFADLLWQYLHKDLLSDHERKPLSEMFYKDEVISEIGEEGSLTYEAAKLAATLNPEIEWLDSEHGKLAIFASLGARSTAQIFIQKLLASPKENMLQIIVQSNIIKALYSQLALEDMQALINGLPIEVLQEIFIKSSASPGLDNILISNTYLDALLELPQPKFYQLITSDNSMAQFKKLALNPSELDNKLQAKHPLAYKALILQQQRAALDKCAEALSSSLKLLEVFGVKLPIPSALAKGFACLSNKLTYESKDPSEPNVQKNEAAALGLDASAPQVMDDFQ